MRTGVHKLALLAGAVLLAAGAAGDSFADSHCENICRDAVVDQTLICAVPWTEGSVATLSDVSSGVLLTGMNGEITPGAHIELMPGHQITLLPGGQAMVGGPGCAAVLSGPSLVNVIGVGDCACITQDSSAVIADDNGIPPELIIGTTAVGGTVIGIAANQSSNNAHSRSGGNRPVSP